MFYQGCYAEQVRAIKDKLSKVKVFIQVDDGSSDGSVEKIKKICELDNSIILIQFHRNYGKSAALSEGFKYANGNYVVTMDADLQDDPSEIKNLIN